MSISYITMKNFKVFPNQSYARPFDKYTVLEGTSESGKTSLLEALVFVLGGGETCFGEYGDLVRSYGNSCAVTMTVSRNGGKRVEYHRMYDKTLKNQYKIDGTWVNKTEYQARVHKLEIMKHGIAPVFNTKVNNIGGSNKSLTTVIDNFSGCAKIGAKIKEEQKKLRTAQETLNKLETKSKAVEEQQQNLFWVLMLKLRKTDYEISYAKVYGESQEKDLKEKFFGLLLMAKMNQLPIPMRKGTLESLTHGRVEDDDQFEVDYRDLPNFLKKKETKENVEERLKYLEDDFRALQIGVFDEDNTKTTVIEKKMTVDCMLAHTKKVIKETEERIEKLHEKRQRSFINFVDRVRVSTNENMALLWPYVPKTIDMTFTDEEVPWKKIEVTVTGGGREESFSGCSGGEKRIVELSLILAIAKVSELPTVFIDTLDHHLDQYTLRKIAEGLSKIATEELNIVVACKDQDFYNKAKENDATFLKL